MGKLSFYTTSAADEIFHLDFISCGSGLTNNSQNIKNKVELIKKLELITPTIIRSA